MCAHRCSSVANASLVDGDSDGADEDADEAAMAVMKMVLCEPTVTNNDNGRNRVTGVTKQQVRSHSDTDSSCHASIPPHDGVNHYIASLPSKLNTTPRGLQHALHGSKPV